MKKVIDADLILSLKITGCVLVVSFLVDSICYLLNDDAGEWMGRIALTIAIYTAMRRHQITIDLEKILNRDRNRKDSK